MVCEISFMSIAAFFSLPSSEMSKNVSLLHVCLHALTLSKLLSQAILTLFLHFCVQFGVSSRQLLFDLALQDDLGTFIIVMLATELD